MMKKNMRQGIALILVLLFTAIALLVVISITTELLIGIKLNRQSKSMSQAYNLARGGIAAEMYYLKNDTTDASNSITDDPQDCATPDYHIYYASGTPPEKQLDLNSWIGGAHQSEIRTDGAYAANLCNGKITSIGFFGGQKLTLEAEVDVTKAVPGTPPATYNHSLDTIKIYQTGS